MAERAFPHVTVKRNVACQSGRTDGVPVNLVVIHDSEGGNIPKSNRDLEGLAGYFDQVSTQASSHVATDEDGQSSRMVPDERKAWHCAYYNSASLGIEQVGFSTQRWTSKAKDEQLRETARWVAYWSRKHNIPIRRAIVLGGKVIRSGVIQHRNLGSLGGGHSDVGLRFAMRKTLRYARHYAKLQEKDPGVVR